MKLKLTMISGLLIAAMATSASAALVALEDFDGGDVNLITSTQSPAPGAYTSAGDGFEPFSHPGGGPFTLFDDSVTGSGGGAAFPGDVIAIVGQAKTDNFFGVVDTVNGDNLGTATASWEFDISGASDLTVSIDMGAMGDFETADTFTFTASIDGGAPVTIFDAVVDDAITHTYRAFDDGDIFSVDDPLTVGGTILDKTVAATGALDTFTAALAGTGSSLVIGFTAEADGGSEGFAFDNIRVDGTIIPEPGSLVLVLLGLVGLAVRRR